MGSIARTKGKDDDVRMVPVICTITGEAPGFHPLPQTTSIPASAQLAAAIKFLPHLSNHSIPISPLSLLLVHILSSTTQAQLSALSREEY